jgi:hypothetical protein
MSQVKEVKKHVVASSAIRNAGEMGKAKRERVKEIVKEDLRNKIEQSSRVLPCRGHYHRGVEEHRALRLS